MTGGAHFTETFISEARAPLFNVIGGLHKRLAGDDDHRSGNERAATPPRSMCSTPRLSECGRMMTTTMRTEAQAQLLRHGLPCRDSIRRIQKALVYCTCCLVAFRPARSRAWSSSPPAVVQTADHVEQGSARLVMKVSVKWAPPVICLMGRRSKPFDDPPPGTSGFRT